MNQQFSEWITQNDIPVSYNSACQLQLENWAYRHGFQNEVEITLVADFLLGLHNANNKIKSSLALSPTNVTLTERLRHAFYLAGVKFSQIAENISDSAIMSFVKDVYAQLNGEIKKSLADNSVMESTGDCRGACKYNTGDRSEYRNYGW